MFPAFPYGSSPPIIILYLKQILFSSNFRKKYALLLYHRKSVFTDFFHTLEYSDKYVKLPNQYDIFEYRFRRIYNQPTLHYQSKKHLLKNKLHEFAT
jgi:hypothetical protein